ncbi:alpha/beta fold hydrolase [Flavitalea flava]
MNTIYLFGGLGTDERVFKDINLSGFRTVFIQWIPPLAGESIENYCRRLSQKIDTPDPVLIGLSFGGMVAVEISKLIETQKVILIASAKTKFEIPFYYRIARSLRLHKLVSAAFLKQPTFFSNWFFGTAGREDKKVLATILRDTDAAFLKWAIDIIVGWKNVTIPGKIIHIHGTKDLVLPYRFVRPDITIAKGGHLMTLNKAREITEVLRGLLKE